MLFYKTPGDTTREWVDKDMENVKKSVRACVYIHIDVWSTAADSEWYIGILENYGILWNIGILEIWNIGTSSIFIDF